MKCRWREQQPHGYNRPIIFRSYFGLQQADHISILCRVTAGRSYSDLISGYSRPILFPYSAKRVRDCRQNHHDCRQNIPWLLWNDLLTTPYVSEYYKYMFLVARDLCEMFVLYRGKHTTRRSTVGIWSEVRVYRTPATNTPCAGVLRLGTFPDNRRSMC